MPIICFTDFGKHCNCVYGYLTNVVRDYLDIISLFHRLFIEILMKCDALWKMFCIFVADKYILKYENGAFGFYHLLCGQLGRCAS